MGREFKIQEQNIENIWLATVFILRVAVKTLAEGKMK